MEFDTDVKTILNEVDFLNVTVNLRRNTDQTSMEILTTKQFTYT